MKLRVALFSSVLAIAVLVAPATLQATPITISGTGALGSFTGSFDYDGSSLVTVVLNNTSPVANHGFLTAFVFNIPAPATVSGVLLVPTDPDFVPLGFATFNNTIIGSPFGRFDIGAAIWGDFEGGGTPVVGIPVGGTATFSFTLTGTHLTEITAADFLSTLSEGVGAGEGHEAFVVRFRGFDNGGSDKVPEGGAIPEPGTTLLLGAGLTALWARRGRNR